MKKCELLLVVRVERIERLKVYLENERPKSKPKFCLNFQLSLKA